MKFQQDRTVGQHIVTAASETYIEINGTRHTTNLLLTPQSVQTDWGQAGFIGLNEQDFAKIAALNCEVVLLGTGRQQRFPTPNLLRPLMNARIGFEVMDTNAACRTYNILVTEGRKVAAALFLD